MKIVLLYTEIYAPCTITPRIIIIEDTPRFTVYPRDMSAPTDLRIRASLDGLEAKTKKWKCE